MHNLQHNQAMRGYVIDDSTNFPACFSWDDFVSPSLKLSGPNWTKFEKDNIMTN